MSYGKVPFGRRVACLAALLVSLVAVAPAFAATTPRFGSRMLWQGMRGPDVTTLQRDLTSLGWWTRPSGWFNYWTAVHVKDFQKRDHLTADGVVGPQTFGRISSAMARIEETRANPTATRGQGGNSTASASSATLPANDSGGSGFVPPNTQANAPVEAATIDSNGLAVAPADAPKVIQQVIDAANKIAFDPYVYGGGHNGWGPQDGYDCSGSVSYALHGGDLLNGYPLDSTQFESYGEAGPGKWITLYTNAGHVYMNVAGLWFDTAAQSSANGNDRWSATRISPASGFVVRHPAGW